MEGPQPPKDTSLRNIIDKLAEFVARNGPEFETMTKAKQKGNPKFEFLYGGEFYQYYQYKIASEQAFVKQMPSSNQMSQQQTGFAPTNTIWTQNQTQMAAAAVASKNNPQIEALNMQQQTLRDQIRQSEQNLSAQHGVLLQQQQSQIEEALNRAQNDLIHKLAEECGLQIHEFDAILQPIIDSCTKESIANGANEDQAAKLSKLLSLWESKANFFDACVISKLRSPPSSMQEYHTSLLTQHAAVITPLTQATKATFENYQQQHQAFVQHASQQIALFEQQRQQIEQQTLKQALTNAATIPPLLPELSQKSTGGGGGGVNNIINNNNNNNSSQQQISRIDATNDRMMGINPPPPPLMSQNIPSLLSANLLSPQQSYNNSNNNNSNNNISGGKNSNGNNNYSGNFESQQNNSNNIPSDFSLPPPNFPVPDLSRPPPGFSTPGSDGSYSLQEQQQQQQAQQQQPQEIPAPIVEDLTPSLPYFELPAGLMVPLIRLEDYNYHALDPDLIRLPPPTPPSDRLISAVEAFYSLPCHDRPRDGEGWEKLGLYEYFKIKNSAKKQKEEEINSGSRDRSRSPTPIDIDLIKPPKKAKKRVYRSKSRSRSPTDSTIKKRNKRSPPAKRAASPVNLVPSRNNTPMHRGRDRGNNNDNRNSMRERRSLSPQAPSFALGNTYTAKPNEFIEETNKGHQMLMKMGWAGSGTGLGTPGQQGIKEPISGGEVRNRQDKYKGVGVSLVDPYENFRKSKGAAFVTRMKARSDV